MKTSKIVLLIFSMMLLVGCGQAPTKDTSSLVVEEEKASEESSAENDAPDTEKLTIALVMKTLTNPFFVEMEKGAREAEKELGINLLVKTGAQETSIEQQISIIKTLIDEKVDAIVIAPADSKQLIPILKKAQDAGIPIVNVDNKLDPEVSKELGLENVPYISVDNEQGAYLSAKYISDQISSPTQVAILEGIQTAKNAQDRRDGAIRAFEENENIEIVAVETANWQIDEANTVISQIYEEHPDIGAVFCANDMMAFGVVQYLQEAGKTEVLVGAYDALDDAKAAIREGTMQTTIDQQAALQAYTGVQFAVQAINGETLSAETLVDVKLITKDNVDE
ncbi:sugar ABC transporter substrate-binding protein [Anaerolineales bacterium HSG24]|nr:sugar ABC transporter substrate-binding protein [Anaerolineales bacterium HSG24]